MNRTLFLFPLAAFCCTATFSAQAGDGKTTAEIPTTAAATEPGAWQFSSELQLDYSYGSDSRNAGVDLRSQNANVQYVLTSQYKEGPPLRFGFEWEGFSFGETAGTQIPNTLHSESIIAGLDLQVFNSVFLRIEAQPGFYSAGARVTERSLDVPVVIGGSYLYDKNLQLVLGVSIDPSRDVPVLPGGGIRWQMNDHWLLNAVLPKPRLEYELTKKVTVYGGANILENSYRADGQFGTATGNTRLNSAWLDYTEIRTGGGATFKLNDKVNVDMELGYTVYRDFDFHRAGVDIHTNDGGMYGAISIVAKF